MELKKSLGVIHVFCIAAGAMISSGIFVLPGLAYAMAGPAVVLSYLLAGVLAATGLLSTAELATAMPKAGSDYYFITRSVGPAFGTIAGVLNWISFSLKSAFALVGMAALIRLLAPIDMRISGVILGVVFVGINLVGVKEAAHLQVALVLGLMALMLVYVFYGLPVISLGNYEPFAPRGMGAVFSTAGLVFVSYGGLLKVASLAEEVRNPGHTIPAGMILALVLVGICYAMMVAVTVGVVTPEVLSGTLTPIADGALVVMGRAGGIAMAIAASLAFLTTANAGILAGSRYLLALSRDGMLPQSVGNVGVRFHTPHVAILATGALVILPLFLDLHILVESASIGLILTNMFSLLSVIILRESRLQNYRPVFRAPLYPWLQIAGLIGFAFLLLQMREEAFVISAALAIIGFSVYWFYGRSQVEHESAILHVLQRLTPRQLVHGTLEAELKEIVRERDEIVADRFDEMTEKCPVLDLQGTMPRDEFFARVADAMSPRLGVPSATLLHLLIKREEGSSTVLTTHLAIPHIIIEDSTPFGMLIARCKPGIHFGEGATEVHTVIVLAGPIQERNFHLRCLAAIAQVVQADDFTMRWLAAPGEQALRDLFVLSRRHRG
ncbi:MAG: amino acid permease [Lentisphaerae bacterium]|nr:amino acid permease [Lentisphaerota bacterium]